MCVVRKETPRLKRPEVREKAYLAAVANLRVQQTPNSRLARELAPEEKSFSCSGGSDVSLREQVGTNFRKAEARTFSSARQPATTSKELSRS